MSWYQPGGSTPQPSEPPPPSYPDAPPATAEETHQFRTSPPPGEFASARSGGLAGRRRVRVVPLAVALVLVVLIVLLYLILA